MRGLDAVRLTSASVLRQYGEGEDGGGGDEGAGREAEQKRGEEALRRETSGAMVGVPGEDGRGAIELLDEHGASDPMRQRHGA